MIDKYIKNVSGVTKTYLGIEVVDNAFMQIPFLALDKFQTVDNLITDINNDDALLSRDGITTLSKADSLLYLEYITNAEYIRFKTEPERSNGFSTASVNTQLAIEEARDSGRGTVLPYPFIATGNTANKWLGVYESAHVSNEVPLIVPQDSDLKGFTFINRDNDVDIDAEVYINGSLVKTFEIRNKRFSYVVGISPPVSCNQGDRISIFLKKYTQGTGDNTAQDPVVTLLLKFTNEAGADSGQQTGVT